MKASFLFLFLFFVVSITFGQTSDPVPGKPYPVPEQKPAPAPEQKPEAKPAPAPEQKPDIKLVLNSSEKPLRADFILIARINTADPQLYPETVAFYKDGKELGKGEKKKEQEQDIWAFTWNIAVETDGVYAIHAEGVKGEQKIASAPVSFTVDKTPPAVKLESFVVKSRQEGLFRASINDKEGLAEVVFSVGTNPIGQAKETNGVYEVIWAIPEAAQGEYVLEVKATDKAGNETKISEKIQVNIPAQPPEIQIVSPAISRGPLVCQAQVKGASELTDVQFLLKEHPESKPIFSHEGNIWTGKWELDKEGQYQITATAVDKFGNKASVEFQIQIDKTPPQVSAELEPKELQIGMVRSSIVLKDNLAGIQTGVKPEVIAELGGKSYPFTIENIGPERCEATLLITENHPEGEAIVYISGLQDKVGNRIERTSLGKFSIKSIGGAWPLVPQDQPHPVLNCYSKDVKTELSGLWIDANAGTEVKAVEEGQIVEIAISSRDIPGIIRIKRWRGDLVWGYHHLIPGKNPSTGNSWALGDIVRKGETLGKVAAIHKEEKSYLYLDLTKWQDGWILAESPLKFISPKMQDKMVSAEILLAVCKEMSAQPDRNFIIPVEAQEGAQKSYQTTDILILAYFVLVILVIIRFIFVSDTKTHLLS